MKVVMTGGPSCGKTTIIEALAAKGYPTLPEMARPLLNAHQKGFLELHPQTHPYEFQCLVSHMQMAHEMAMPGRVCLDRSLVDIVGYCDLLGVDTPPGVREFIAENRYDQVFLLDLLPFEDDGVRYESPEEALLVHNHIKKAYREFGYDPIEVPVMETVKDRADYVLEMIGGIIQ